MTSKDFFRSVPLSLLSLILCSCPPFAKNPKDAELTCWLDPNIRSSNMVDLVVRTVNTERGMDNYPKRLIAIAQKFFAEWPNQIGIIGMQQVKTNMTSCPDNPSVENGAHCFGKILHNEYGISPVNSKAYELLGIISSGSWVIKSHEGWKIGDDGIFNSDRHMIMANVFHSTYEKHLKFYNVHLSHRSRDGTPHRSENRLAQTIKLIEIITNQAQENELLPIVVGDFNVNPSSPDLDGNDQEVLNKMNEKFELLNEKSLGCLTENHPGDVGIDLIWIGKKEAFPNSTGAWRLIRYHTDRARGQGIELRTSATIDGTHITKISDHPSPAFSLKIDWGR